MLKSGGCWIDPPDVYGPHKTLYSLGRRRAYGYSGIRRRPASASLDRQLGGEGTRREAAGSMIGGRSASDAPLRIRR
jgi:hypothetical protein